MKTRFYNSLMYELYGISVEVHDYKGKRALRSDEIDRLHNKPFGTAKAMLDKRLLSFKPDVHFNGYGGTTYLLRDGYNSITALWVEPDDAKIRNAILHDYYLS